MNKILGYVIAAGCMHFMAPAGAQNLVTNGDFEVVKNRNGVVQAAGDNYIVKSPSIPSGYTLTGWTRTGTVGVVYGSGVADSSTHGPLLDPLAGEAGICSPNQGSRVCSWLLRGSQDGIAADAGYVVAASSPAGGNFYGSDGNFEVGPLTQTVSGMTVGQAYTLSFWSAGGVLGTSVGAGTDTASWTVTLTGKTTDVNKTVNMGSFSALGGTTPWIQTVVSFTASATSEVLSFMPGGTGSPPMSLLDGVSIVAVPEPQQWLMLGAGLVMLSGLRLRRRSLQR